MLVVKVFIVVLLIGVTFGRPSEKTVNVQDVNIPEQIGSLFGIGNSFQFDQLGYLIRRYVDELRTNVANVANNPNDPAWVRQHELAATSYGITYDVYRMFVDRWDYDGLENYALQYGNFHFCTYGRNGEPIYTNGKRLICRSEWSECVPSGRTYCGIYVGNTN